MESRRKAIPARDGLGIRTWLIRVWLNFLEYKIPQKQWFKEVETALTSREYIWYLCWKQHSPDANWWSFAVAIGDEEEKWAKEELKKKEGQEQRVLEMSVQDQETEARKMEARVEAVEQKVSELRKWLAEDRAAREVAKAECKEFSGQLAELLGRGTTSSHREAGQRNQMRGQKATRITRSAASRGKTMRESQEEDNGVDDGGERLRWRQRSLWKKFGRSTFNGEDPFASLRTRDHQEEDEAVHGGGEEAEGQGGTGGRSSTFIDGPRAAADGVSSAAKTPAETAAPPRCRSRIGSSIYRKEEGGGLNEEPTKGSPMGPRPAAGGMSPPAVALTEIEVPLLHVGSGNNRKEKEERGIFGEDPVATVIVAAAVQAKIVAAKWTFDGGGVRKKQEAATRAPLHRGSFSFAPLGQAQRRRGEKNEESDNRSPLVFLMGQAQINRNGVFEIMFSADVVALMGQAQIDIETYLLMLMAQANLNTKYPELFADSAIRQWDPGGVHMGMSDNKSMYSPP